MKWEHWNWNTESETNEIKEKDHHNDYSRHTLEDLWIFASLKTLPFWFYLFDSVWIECWIPILKKKDMQQATGLLLAQGTIVNIL